MAPRKALTVLETQLYASRNGVGRAATVAETLLVVEGRKQAIRRRGSCSVQPPVPRVSPERCGTAAVRC